MRPRCRPFLQFGSHADQVRKGNKSIPKICSKNGISQQPTDENGIRFLRLVYLWNPSTSEEEKTVLHPVFTCFSVSTNRNWAYIVESVFISESEDWVNNKLTNRFQQKIKNIAFTLFLSLRSLRELCCRFFNIHITSILLAHASNTPWHSPGCSSST